MFQGIFRRKSLNAILSTAEEGRASPPQAVAGAFN